MTDPVITRAEFLQAVTYERVGSECQQSTSDSSIEAAQQRFDALDSNNDGEISNLDSLLPTEARSLVASMGAAAYALEMPQAVSYVRRAQKLVEEHVRRSDDQTGIDANISVGVAYLRAGADSRDHGAFFTSASSFKRALEELERSGEPRSSTRYNETAAMYRQAQAWSTYLGFDKQFGVTMRPGVRTSSVVARSAYSQLQNILIATNLYSHGERSDLPFDAFKDAPVGDMRDFATRTINAHEQLQTMHNSWIAR